MGTWRSLWSIVVVGVLLVSTVLVSPPAFADQITLRKLTLETGNTDDGGSLPGGTVNHRFTFTVPVGGSVGSIAFEYCTTASGSCTLPTGLVTTNATLGDESGATGFSIDTDDVNGRPYLTRTATAITASTELEYLLEDIDNPTAINTTFYVRIATYTNTDATGTAIDSGSVAASTAAAIQITGTMPESLIFCTGETISTTSGIPDCSTATPGEIEFDKLFSPINTAFATSQMAASTNASTGYVITVSGATLTSGSDFIDPIATAEASVKGKSQFGLNLVENTTTLPSPFGAVVTPAASVPDKRRGRAVGDYATADVFKYVSGDVVADSAAGGIGPTNPQIYTVSYIANVPGAQAAGTYVATLTYVCTPTF